MNAYIHFLELTLSPGTTNFNKQLDRAYENATKMYAADFGHVDETFVSKGFCVSYHDDSKKKNIRVIVHPATVINTDSDSWKPTGSNIERLISKLDKRISSYFPGYSLGDFKLARVDFAVDIDVGSRERVSDYIRVLHNIGRVKCFSPMKYKREDMAKADCFGLTGNTNGIDFRAQRLTHKKKTLRVEVRLTKKAVIRACADDGGTAGQIKALAKRSCDVLMDIFRHIVPGGNYYKKKAADALIREWVKDRPLRRKMLRFLTLCHEKKSLHLAQRNLGSRDIKEIMKKFEEIGVSPVTISKET
jgi:hypothetical protein